MPINLFEIPSLVGFLSFHPIFWGSLPLSFSSDRFALVATNAQETGDLLTQELGSSLDYFSDFSALLIGLFGFLAVVGLVIRNFK